MFATDFWCSDVQQFRCPDIPLGYQGTCPLGTLTQQGLIAVSDYDNKCVTLFDMDGKFRSRLGAGKMLGPKGIATTSRGDIVVIDNKVK